MAHVDPKLYRQVTYHGEDDIRVRKAPGDEKETVKKGETFDCHPECVHTLRTYKDFEILHDEGKSIGTNVPTPPAVKDKAKEPKGPSKEDKEKAETERLAADKKAKADKKSKADKEATERKGQGK